MANVKKALYNVAVFLVSLFITGSINVSNIKNTQDTSRVTLTVNETETLQERGTRAEHIQIQRRLGRKAEPQLPSRSRFVEEHGELPCI